MVLNKSEGHPSLTRPGVDGESIRNDAVRVSALDGSGLDRLVERMASLLWDRNRDVGECHPTWANEYGGAVEPDEPSGDVSRLY